MIQFNKIFIQLENQGIVHHYSCHPPARTATSQPATTWLARFSRLAVAKMAQMRQSWINPSASNLLFTFPSSDQYPSPLSALLTPSSSNNNFYFQQKRPLQFLQHSSPASMTTTMMMMVMVQITNRSPSSGGSSLGCPLRFPRPHHSSITAIFMPFSPPSVN